MELTSRTGVNPQVRFEATEATLVTCINHAHPLLKAVQLHGNDICFFVHIVRSTRMGILRSDARMRNGLEPVGES